MKSRIVKRTARAVGVNMSSEKAAVLKKLAAELGAELVCLDESCGGDTVGHVCGEAGCKKSADTAMVSEELLILSGFERDKLDSFITKLRAEGCYIPLKAAATRHNLSWTVKALAEEIKSEHEAMKSYSRERQAE